MGPLVSVVLPVYNREACVGRAIASVLGQTYRQLELLVVDDGSTDGTRRVLDGFGSRITVIAQPHAGVYPARNLGVRNARGELVAFIDSDDVWLPDKLERQLPLMQRGEVGLVFGDAVQLTAPESAAPRTGSTSFRVAPPRRGRVAGHFAWCNFVPTVTVLVRRRCLDDVGGFPETTDVSADYLTWFRIALRYELDYVDQTVAEYTVHPSGISYDLGRSIAARIGLFSDELSRTNDPAVRATLRRLLFHLALSMLLAAGRGRARSVAHPLRTAWRTAANVAGLEAAPWAAAFAVNQMLVRTRRLFS